MATTLWVTPVQRIPTQGRDKQTFEFVDPKTGQIVTTKAMNKTREIGSVARYAFVANYQKGKYETGLEETMPNPFKDLDVESIMTQYSLGTEWRDILPNITSQPKITKQVYYEILHGQKPGFYDTTADIENSVFRFHPGKYKNESLPKSSFIASFNISCYDGPNRFTDETPRGMMAIQLIKNHPKFAASKQHVNPSLHDFYISEENEAAMERLRKQDIIDEVTSRKVTLLRSTSTFKPYQVACLLTKETGKPVITGEANIDLVKQQLNLFLGEGKEQFRNIEQFNNLLDLLNSKETQPRFEILYLLQQAKNTGLVSQSNGVTWWVSRRDTDKYKWDSFEKLTNFLVQEYATYLPGEEEQTNYYKILVDELKAKNIRME